MPSDSPPHPSSSGPEPTLATTDTGAPARETATVPNDQRGRRNPRVIAALCYAVPYVVALWVLLRERRNRFVRFHAAQALIFFVTVPLIQLLLFVVLVVVGNLVSISIGTLAFVLGLLFICAFVAVGVGALFLWLWMLADCWAGQATVFPILGSLAHRLERLLTEVRREVARSRTVRQNDMV